ncbi:MAG TPA: DUF4157 domain-containing protein [Pyrinomonadaceae bacterium]|nr:DUF4157 domain-containing protein [Pyrinomonadaceae bacterium]
MNSQAQNISKATAGDTGLSPVLLQRSCACGQHTNGTGECTSCNKSRDTLQRSTQHADSETHSPGIVPPIVHEVLHSPGQPLDSSTRAFFEPRFGHDFSQVRVHTDQKAAVSSNSVSAEAYTVGSHLVFGAGQYRPATHDGKHLLAHELTHVMQQGEGSIPSRLELGSAGSTFEHQADAISSQVVNATESLQTQDAHNASEAHPPSGVGVGAGQIQRRRVPEGTALAPEVPTAPAGLMVARTGLARLLSRAWAGLSTTDQATVRTAAGAFGISWTNEASLLLRLDIATRDQLLSFANAIRTASPAAQLGDPNLIDTGARAGTSDAANITTVVNAADTVFGTIASGANDADLTAVFGAANVPAAKTKYANARTRMNALKAIDKIVTDRSGYSGEVGLGGLSNPEQIAIHSNVIDNPSDNESVVMLIHESMHAGNSDIRDFGYITQPSFVALDESVKLTNAAHFEVVPRRIRSASHSFPGVTFIPAGTTVGGVTAPALTSREQAIRGASETYRAAWTVGLNLHKLYLRVFRAPTEWNTLDLGTAFGTTAGSHFEDALPFWSNVEALTIHTRTINPAGTPAEKPVTLIDMALSEGLVRKLSQGMNSVPQTEVAAQTLETNRASAAERTAAAASVNAERDLLIKLVIRTSLGSLTGTESRDARVVARMAAASLPTFSDMLGVRPPSAFP